LAAPSEFLAMCSIAQTNRPTQARATSAAFAELSKLAIIARIVGSDTATAEHITVTSASPILALCRALVAAGFDPARPLYVYRGETLALYVCSLGQGAALVVASNGVGFVRRCGAPQTEAAS
jgi:hypothetical protein